MMGIRARRRVGAVLWGVGVLIALVWGWSGTSQRTGVPGIGHAEGVRVSAVEDGRVKTLSVSLHDTVGAGEVLVELDSSALNAEREVAAADFLAMAQVPQVDVNEVRKRVDEKTRRSSLQSQLAIVDARIRTLQTLVDTGAASPSEVSDAQLKRSSLLQKLRRVRPDIEEAQTTAWSVVAALRRLEQVELRLKTKTLRSTIDGHVAEVYHRPGEVVVKGATILTVQPDATQEVLAYVQAHQTPSQGAGVTIVRGNGSRLSATVISVSPGLRVIPEQIWTLPGRPEYGRAVLVRADIEVLLPGEPVRVWL